MHASFCLVTLLLLLLLPAQSGKRDVTAAARTKKQHLHVCELITCTCSLERDKRNSIKVAARLLGCDEIKRWEGT